MNPSKSLQKAINRAISYVSASKRYNPACEIINTLITAVNGYLKYVERSQSDLESENFGLTFRNDSKRLKRIMELYNCDMDLTDEEITLLENLKDRTQYFVSNSASFTLFKYKFVDLVLKNKMPDKITRPKNINQLEKAYDILTEKYGNSKNRLQPSATETGRHYKRVETTHKGE